MKKILVLMLLICFISLLYGCDKEEDLGHINIQVVADTGIEIALGGIDRTPASYKWVTTLTTTSFNQTIKDLYPEGFSFRELTSPDGKVFFQLGVDQMVEVTQGYLEILIHFRSNQPNSIILGNFALDSFGENWTSDVDFTDSKNNQILAGDDLYLILADALRFSLSTDQDTYVFEKPIDGTNTHIGKITSYDTENLRGSASYFYAKTQTLPMFMTSFDLPEMTFLEEYPTILELQAVDSNVFGADYYGSVRLRLWFEILDLESYQTTLDQKMELSLLFGTAMT